MLPIVLLPGAYPPAGVAAPEPCEPAPDISPPVDPPVDMVGAELLAAALPGEVAPLLLSAGAAGGVPGAVDCGVAVSVAALASGAVPGADVCGDVV